MITPSIQTFGDGLIVVPLGFTEKAREGGCGGGNILSSVLDRLSLMKWCNNQADMSVSKLLIPEEIDGVSREIERQILVSLA